MGGPSGPGVQLCLHLTCSRIQYTFSYPIILLYKQVARPAVCDMSRYVFLERMCNNFLAATLMLYLSGGAHVSMSHHQSSVSLLTAWTAAVFLSAVAWSILADVYNLYIVVLISLATYLLAMVTWTVLAWLEATNHHLPAAVRFMCLFNIALAASGSLVTIPTFGAREEAADDHGDDRSDGRKQLHFLDRYTMFVFVGCLIGETGLVAVRHRFGWSVAYTVSLACLALGVSIFLAGTISRWGEMCSCRAPTVSAPWCAATDFTKMIKKVTPLWLTALIPSMAFAALPTLFLEQARTLDGVNIGHLTIPPESFKAFATLASAITAILYARGLPDSLRRWITCSQTRITLTSLQRMGIGFAIQFIAMVISIPVETERMKSRSHTAAITSRVLGSEKVSLTMWVLLPQYVLMGIADTFISGGRLDFFSTQVPGSTGASMSFAAVGGGNLLSSFTFKFTQNKFKTIRGCYKFLCILCSLNFVGFILLSYRYMYTTDKESAENDTEAEGSNTGETSENEADTSLSVCPKYPTKLIWTLAEDKSPGNDIEAHLVLAELYDFPSSQLHLQIHGRRSITNDDMERI